MVGSKEAGVDWVMSLRISSSVYAESQLVAILAIGKPVALDARAEERLTRGFISMTMMRPGVRVHGELDVAAARVDAHAADDGDADVTQLLVFAIGQGEAGGHGDGVTGVHADRVDVLDRADDHDVVVAVAHQSSSNSFQPSMPSSSSTSSVGE